jgi:NAD(H)-dependent 7beta-hydroxy-3-oxo-delta4-cholenoic acid oxidoreductase
MKPLKNLFRPIKIGSMEIKNRMAMAPMATDFANPDGTISQKMIDYFGARAKGGVGLIIMEVVTIDELSPYVPNTVALWDDKFIPSLKTLSDAIHAHGAKVIPQISHPGPESLAPLFNGTQTVGPSPTVNHTTKQKCRELTIEEIEKIVDQFGDAARRAREADCDGVELHAAHSYMLVGSFLSPLRNRRIDAYGGTVHERLKFPLEVIQSIRAKAGEDFPIVMRISGDMMVPGGQDIRETQYIAPILAEAGIDAFEISAGIFPDGMFRIIPPTGSPLRPNVKLSLAVKEVVDVPILVVGRINDPRIAEDILNRHEADMVVMGRALLADPEFPNKAAEGRFDDIRPCVGCGLGCIAVRNAGKDMTCVLNPTLGREAEMPIVAASQPKNVMVAGGGPAGLEAARVAALRGHKVTLYDQEAKPGGQLNLAAAVPFRQEISKIPKYFSAQAEKAGVDIRLNTEVTEELVREVRPDVLVVATGAEPLIPNIPGAEGERVVSAHGVLGDKVDVLPGKVLIVGGGMVGCETAETIANRGDNPIIGRTDVTLLEMVDDVALDTAPQSRDLLMQRLREKGVHILTSSKVVEFLEDGIVIERDGEQETIRGVDRIVLSMGVKSFDPLSEKIKGEVPEVYAIGDAKEARSALEAIAEGAEIGRRI